MEGTQQYPSGAAKWILVMTAISCAVLELIDSTIVNVSLREISGNIGATSMEIGWVSTAYGIGNVIVIPLSGMLSNLYGRKRYFTGSVALFTLASLMCGLSSSLWGLVGWRFIQGLAGGGLLSTAMSIVIGAFPPEQAKTAFVSFAIGLMLGPILGPVLGGVITDSLSWHWIFFVNIPVGTLAAILSWKYVENLEGAEKPRKIDWPGIVFIAIALGCLQYVLEEGAIHDWFESREICSFFGAAIAAFIAFIWRELSVDEPAVNLRLYKNLNMVMGNIISLLVGFMLNGTLFIFPMLAQGSLGWSATKTGAFLVSGGVAAAFAMILSKRFFPNVSPRTMMLTGLITVIVSLLPLGYSSFDSGEEQFFWPFIIRNIGIAFIIPNMVSLAVGQLRGKDLAQATGLSTMLRQLGGAIGVAVISIYTSDNSVFVRKNLVSHLNDYSAATQERLGAYTQTFIASGYAPDDAATAAYAMLEHTLVRQQTIISYNHGFLFFVVLIAFCIPVVLLIRKVPPGAAMQDTH
jgi:DHA2 family multidrug resistance protein